MQRKYNWNIRRRHTTNARLPFSLCHSGVCFRKKNEHKKQHRREIWISITLIAKPEKNSLKQNYTALPQESSVSKYKKRLQPHANTLKQNEVYLIFTEPILSKRASFLDTLWDTHSHKLKRKTQPASDYIESHIIFNFLNGLWFRILNINMSLQTAAAPSR